MHGLEWFLGLLCHQEPSRSFVIGGTLMLVCARCFGLYLGLFFGMISVMPRSLRDWITRWSTLAVVVAANFSTWLIAPLDTNPWRFVLGLLCGFVVTARSQMAQSLSTRFGAWWTRRRQLGHARHQG